MKRVLGYFITYLIFALPRTGHAEPSIIRYVPIGDSYTIGQGVSPGERWTRLLERQLQKAGFDFHIITNPARSGWTVQDAIHGEVPTFIAARPSFTTVLLGANDWVRGNSKEQFKRDVQKILNELGTILKNKRCITIVSIPDFSLAPMGKLYTRGRNPKKGIAEYNAILRKEAEIRGLEFADIFPRSQRSTHPDWFASDLLHPSAKQYRSWIESISPAVTSTLKKHNCVVPRTAPTATSKNP